jgi:hypothetical protein
MLAGRQVPTCIVQGQPAPGWFLVRTLQFRGGEETIMKKKQKAAGVSSAVVGGVTGAIVVSQGLSLSTGIALGVVLGLIGGIASLLLRGRDR